MLQMKLPFCEMLFLSNLYPTNHFNIAKFHAQISTKLKKQRHWFNVHSLKSFKTLQGPQKPIYHLVWQFFSDKSRNTEGTSTGKTLQERFS